MKRLSVLVLLLLLAGLMAAPASAQGLQTNGDHLCIGSSTTVRSDETPNSVVLFGCGARIENGARVRKDVVSFGGNVVIDQGAQVGGDVVVFGGNLQLGGEIGHRVTVFGGNLTLEPSSVVDNDVQVFGGNADRRPGATVRGRFLGTTGTVTTPGFPFANPFWYGGLSAWRGFFSGVLQSFITALGLAALGVLILVFLPTHVRQVGETAQQAALPSLGIGCLTWLVVPPLMILFVITCLGIPLAAVLGLALVAAGVFGWIAIGLVLGERLLTGFKVANVVPIVAMLIGLLVLWLVTAVPFIGWLIWLFAASLALGAVVLTRFGTQSYPPVAPVTSSAMTPVAPPAPPAPARTEEGNPPA